MLHSLWIGWTFTLGFFNWVAFFYISFRARRVRWSFWGLIYFASFVLAIIFVGNPAFDIWIGDVTAAFTILLSVISIVHAFKIRKEYLARLKTLQRDKSQGILASEQDRSELHHATERSAEPDSDRKRPLSTSGNTLIPYEELIKVCIKYVSDGYYVGEVIPEKKLNNARIHLPIPDEDRIVALIDTTIFGSSKTGLAICKGGIYWRNDWTTKTNRTSLSWDEFSYSTIVGERKPSSTIELAEGCILNLSGSAFQKADAIKLLLDIRSLTETVMQNRNKTVPRRGGDRPENTDRAATNKRAEKVSVAPDRSNPSELSGKRTEEDDMKSEETPHSSTKGILANYPIPLSYSYRLVEAEFESLRVLKETYRSAEGLTAFLASLVLALTETPTGGTRKQLLNSWGGRGATFGNWLSTLERAAHHIDQEKGSLYRSTGQVLSTKQETSLYRDLRWLMERRNELHHSDLPVGDETNRLIEEVRERLVRCILETEPLWKHPLRLVLDYDAIRNSEYVVATCLDYSGDHPVGRKVQEKYRGVPKKQDLYIVQDKDEWVTLYPFISIHHCHHCHARETYFVDNWAGIGERAHLRSLERAHEETSHEIGEDLARRLGLEDTA